ncbi:MAG: hypothetical protein PVF17_02675 [Ignavibacteria bacterium]|jgi:hypothetical protein
MSQIVLPNRNFNEKKFNRIFRIKKFDWEKKHSKEFKKLQDQSREFKSRIPNNSRIELKQKHFRELSTLWIETMIESFDSKLITKRDISLLNLKFQNFLRQYISKEVKGMESALLSYGIPSGAIILSAKEGIKSALRKVSSISMDMFNNDIENHNNKLEDFQKNSNRRNSISLDESVIKFISKGEFNEKIIWGEIRNEFNYSKIKFGKKINFIHDKFKKKIIFRDIAQSFYLVKTGCYKPGVILAGGVIEELLRLYVISKAIKPVGNTFEDYLRLCEKHNLLTIAINKLSDSVRHFRNFVHLKREENSKSTISKSIAIGAISSIFTIANDF